MEKRVIFIFRYQTIKWKFEDEDDKKIHSIKRPTVMVLLRGKNKRELIEPFLLDSGADRPFIKYDLAKLLGCKLGKKIEKVKTAGKDIDVYTTRVNMGLYQRNGYCELGNVLCYVFLEGKTNVPNVMGRNPLFEKFRIVFEQYNGTVRLTNMENVMSRRIGRKKKR